MVIGSAKANSYQQQFLFCVFLISFLLVELKGQRIFTSIDGRTLEASIIETGASTVTIQRSPDERIFTLNIDQLIPAEAAYIKKWYIQNQAENESTHEKEAIGRWPRRLKPGNYKIEIVSEDNETKTYIYRTPHFEFHSNVKLARKVVREFSQIFESTLLAVDALPLKLNPGHSGDALFLTKIFETKEQYMAAGGIPNSAGVYFPEDRKVMVPLVYLGVKKSSSAYTIDKSREVNLLAHEITHQVTHDWLNKLPVWVIEGLAEYIESVPYERGAFRFDRYEIDEVLNRSYYKLTCPEVLMNMESKEWSQTLVKNSQAASTNYLSAFVLFYYFCHFDFDEDGRPRRLYDYLRAIEAGKNRKQALQILLNGCSYEELEEAVIKAYKREDVVIQFL